MRASGKWMTRIGSILATLGFFLPSVLVSCSSFGFGQSQSFSIYEMASSQLINQGVLYLVPILLLAALAMAFIPAKVYGRGLAAGQLACLLGGLGAFAIAGISMSNQAQKVSGPASMIPFLDLSKAVSITVDPQYGAVVFGGGYLLAFLGVLMQLLGKESQVPAFYQQGQPPYMGNPPPGSVPSAYQPQGSSPGFGYPPQAYPGYEQARSPLQPMQQPPGNIPPTSQSYPPPPDVSGLLPVLTPMSGNPVEAATQAIGHLAQLEVISGTFTGRVFPLTQPQMVIGRAPTCDICLVDQTISRSHAIIWNEQGTWCIADQGSMSGVLVNGQAVQSAWLHAGDTLTLGAITLILRE